VVGYIIFLEELVDLSEGIPCFCVTDRFTVVLRNPAIVYEYPILRPLYPVYTFMSDFTNTHFNTIAPIYASLSGLILRRFPTEKFYTFLTSPYVIHIPFMQSFLNRHLDNTT
jgi:hypothetical protein